MQGRPGRHATIAWALAAALAAGACGREEAPTAGGDARRGQQAWLANCIACHNLDPSRDGSVGPAVKGASAALLEARVLRGEYPPGYTPKRNTKVMPPRPDLAPTIPDLAAYLR
jgi:mono/diheme cytochrome c family protein